MLECWRQIAEPRNAKLLAAVAEAQDLNDAATLSALRRNWHKDLVHVAVELTLAREKAAAKFDKPNQLFADVEGVEQATSFDVARHKAQRFAQTGFDSIADLGCGIGGDAMALSQIADVCAIDKNPVRAWMTRQNCNAHVAAADVTTLKLDGRPVHLDPSRRAGGRRLWNLKDCLPGPDFIHQVAQHDAAIKLSPAVSVLELPPGEVEYISRRGTLVQAVLWTGRLARHACTVTRIDDQQSMHGQPGQDLLIDDPMRFLYVIDPLIDRADLLGELCSRTGLPMIDPMLALMTSDQLIENPWLTPFEVIESMPFRKQKIKSWLHAHDGGIVEIKKRGVDVDPDRLQMELRGKGSTNYTLFIQRLGRKSLAFLTRRLI